MIFYASCVPACFWSIEATLYEGAGKMHSILSQLVGLQTNQPPLTSQVLYILSIASPNLSDASCVTFGFAQL